MYTISWNNGVDELCGTAKSIIQLACYLECNKTKFTVSDRSGKLKQEYFGVGDFTYWVQDFS